VTAHADKAPAATPFKARAPMSAALDDATDVASEESAEASRKPGDFVVYRFSGTFREEPITLTERVIAREGTFVVLDVTFEEGRTKQQFRVRMNDAPSARGEVSTVARIENGAEKPTSLGLFEALMARTALVADQNEAVVGSEALTVDVGNAP